MKISLGFSPCPNDTFIFDAMIHGKIDTEGLEFEVVMEDVEKLNKMAFDGALDVTKLSYHAYAFLRKEYVLLTAGSALGNNCGPLLIGKKLLNEKEINSARIAIPGKYTTANFLLGLAYPNAKNKVEMLFSDIESAVLDNKVDAGLIIHENRFTYQEKGLKKIIDLGEFWESKMDLPIPLGGIVVKRIFSEEVQRKINRIMEKSVKYAMNNPSSSESFVKKYAQEMELQIMHDHINLYVNEYTVKLGESGETAVNKLFEEAERLDLVPRYTENNLIN